MDVVYWIDGDFGYALSGQIGRKAMQQQADAACAKLVTAVWQQLIHRRVGAPQGRAAFPSMSRATASATLMPSTPADRIPPA